MGSYGQTYLGDGKVVFDVRGVSRGRRCPSGVAPTSISRPLNRIPSHSPRRVSTQDPGHRSTPTPSTGHTPTTRARTSLPLLDSRSTLRCPTEDPGCPRRVSDLLNEGGTPPLPRRYIRTYRPSPPAPQRIFKGGGVQSLDRPMREDQSLPVVVRRCPPRRACASYGCHPSTGGPHGFSGPSSPRTRPGSLHTRIKTIAALVRHVFGARFGKNASSARGDPDCGPSYAPDPGA